METPPEHQATKRLGAYMLVIGWVLILALASLLYHRWFFSTKEAKVLTQNGHTQIELVRHWDGHFHMSGMLNGVELSLLLDTGASLLAIPMETAKKANLPLLHPTQISTAGGVVTGYYTQIEAFQLGPIIFHDVRAIIMPDLDSGGGLLGVNILQKFDILRSDNKMTLVYENMH